MGVEFFRADARDGSHMIFYDAVVCKMRCGTWASGRKSGQEYATHTKNGHFTYCPSVLVFPVARPPQSASHEHS